jgi:hypothetical protein
MAALAIGLANKQKNESKKVEWEINNAHFS